MIAIITPPIAKAAMTANSGNNASRKSFIAAAIYQLPATQGQFEPKINGLNGYRTKGVLICKKYMVCGIRCKYNLSSELCHLLSLPFSNGWHFFGFLLCCRGLVLAENKAAETYFAGSRRNRFGSFLDLTATHSGFIIHRD